MLTPYFLATAGGQAGPGLVPAMIVALVDPCRHHATRCARGALPVSRTKTRGLRMITLQPVSSSDT